MGKSKKRGKKSKDDKDLEKQRRKAKAAKKADKGKGEKAASGKQAGTAEQGATSPTATPAPDAHPATADAGGVDQVGVLKLALRDTEAKLVAAEHRLHQVQQQLEDERRALADATGTADQEAVVDAAVAETVAEAVVAAVAEQGGQATGAPAEVAATTLEEAAEAIEAALAGADPGGQERSGLTPPLPHEGADDRPSASWTLVRLRKEADRRGITGVSNLPKAALVERLNA